MVDPDLTLCDYFAVVGFDKNHGLNVDEAAESAAEFAGPSQGNQKTPLECAYEAKVLAHFPAKRAGFPFAHEISSLCMPKGVRFYTQRKVPKEPSFHSFVIIREDGSRINGCALTFYEEVLDESIRQRMYDLQLDHIRDMTAAADTSPQDRMHYPPGAVSSGNHTLPRRSSSRREQSKRASFYDSTSKPIYATKCMCLVTRVGIVFTAENILRALWRMIYQTDAENHVMPIESFIYWVLHEIPLPVPGAGLQVSYGGFDLVVKRPGAKELPFFDYPIQSVFNYVSVEKFIKLFTCFLLEHQILLCSKHMDRLMLFAECLSALVFPFRWQVAYVPILPYSQLKFIEAPVPYLMGLCYDDRIPDQIFQSNVCILDIDSGHLEHPEDVPSFPRHRQLITDLVHVIHAFRTASQRDARRTTDDGVVLRARGRAANRNNDLWSKKRMSRSFDEHGLNEELSVKHLHSIEEPTAVVERDEPATPLLDQKINCYFQGLSFNNAVRELFFAHFAHLFANYEGFLIHDSNAQEPGNRDSVMNYDKASFLSEHPDSYLPFLAAFLETQMFTSFIDAKILAQWQAPDSNVVLFDRRIREIQAKRGKNDDEASSKAFSSLELSSRSQSFDYDVPMPHDISGSAATCYNGIFPALDPRLFELKTTTDEMPRSPWRQPIRRPKEADSSDEADNVAAKPSPEPNTSLPGESPMKIASQNWKFVEQLLKETKTRTKRMLVVKIGKEAVHLGHGDVGITGVEENTLVAGFCDLLERVWAHGLKRKQGKSALWAHVLLHQERVARHEQKRGRKSSSNLSPERPREDCALSDVPSLPDNPTNADAGALSDLLESMRNIARGFESTAADNAETGDDSVNNNWSKALLRAANFISDKINANTLDASDGTAEESTNTVPRQLSAGTWQPRYARYEAAAALPPAGRQACERERRVCPSSSRRALVDREGNAAPDAPRQFDRSRSVDRFIGFMRRSNSVSDFGPNGGDRSWTNAESASAVNAPTQRTPKHKERKRSVSRPRSPAEFEKTLPPLPTDISYDLKNVMKMTEIKTDIGFARAFVRLALERKLLHKHLKTVLQSSTLLQKIYKRYAFLRCEEEREQFLCHVLSLNAVEFSCFTHTFIQTKIQYEVLLVGSLDKHATSSVWIMLTGSLGSSQNVPLPPNGIQFTFDHKNLGVLSTLRIGHSLGERGQSSPKWFLDYVIVRNNITAQTFRFSCGRWFGRSVDDGALERLLVAEVVPTGDGSVEDMNGGGSFGFNGGFISRPESPVSGILTSQKPTTSYYSTASLARRRRSPSVGRTMEALTRHTESSVGELLRALGDAVNSLVKYFLSERDYKSGAQLTPLLCGEFGLIPRLEQVFTIGRQDSLFSKHFFRQSYPWDYIEKVFSWFVGFFRNGESRKLTQEQRSLIIYAYNLIMKISSNNAVGKEGKFHVFVLLTLRDHILAGLLPLMAWTPVTAQMYDESAFLRQPQHLSYLSKLLCSLNEYEFNFEKSLTYGIEF